MAALRTERDELRAAGRSERAAQDEDHAARAQKLNAAVRRTPRRGAAPASGSGRPRQPAAMQAATGSDTGSDRQRPGGGEQRMEAAGGLKLTTVVYYTYIY